MYAWVFDNGNMFKLVYIKQYPPDDLLIDIWRFIIRPTDWYNSYIYQHDDNYNYR